MIKGPSVSHDFSPQVIGNANDQHQCLLDESTCFAEKASSAIVEPSFSSDNVINVRSILEITFICYLCLFVVLSIAFALPLWLIHVQQRKNINDKTNKDASSRINATQKTSQNSEKNQIQQRSS